MDAILYPINEMEDATSSIRRKYELHKKILATAIWAKKAERARRSIPRAFSLAGRLALVFLSLLYLFLCANEMKRITLKR